MFVLLAHLAKYQCPRTVGRRGARASGRPYLKSILSYRVAANKPRPPPLVTVVAVVLLTRHRMDHIPARLRVPICRCSYIYLLVDRVQLQRSKNMQYRTILGYRAVPYHTWVRVSGYRTRPAANTAFQIAWHRSTCPRTGTITCTVLQKVPKRKFAVTATPDS